MAAGLAQSFTFSREGFDRSYPALLVAAAGPECRGYLLGFRHLTFYANSPVGWVEEVFVVGRDRHRGGGRALMNAFEQITSAQNGGSVRVHKDNEGCSFVRALLEEVIPRPAGS